MMKTESIKKTAFPYLASLYNIICVILLIFIPIYMERYIDYIVLAFYIAGLFYEYLKYKRLNPEQRFIFSKKCFLVSAIIIVSIIVIAFFYIKTEFSVDKQESAFFKLALLIYIYCYPVFVFPPFVCILMYSHKSNLFKIIVGILTVAILSVLPRAIFWKTGEEWNSTTRKSLYF